MPARVTFQLGDLFHGSADLIVLPCSTGGTMTPFVEERLAAHHIPEPPEMELGKVTIIPFRGAENIATYVAWAASVADFESTPEAIEAIGQAVGAETKSNDAVDVVSAPLLGAGAGGLDPVVVVERLRDGFLPEADDRATLQIFVMDPELFETLKAQFEERDEVVAPAEAVASEPIRVFVSYTDTSDEHVKWVEGLARHLRQNGINSRFDKWYNLVGTEVAQWMANEIDQAQRVLLICNEEYASRADGLHGGVGWEIRVLQGDMYLSPEKKKYVPLVRADDIKKGLPKFLQSTAYIHWPSSASDADKREQLLKELYEFNSEPPLGPPPVWLRPSS